jgi:enoyl-CoA hydratase/carnithine racemase
MAYSTISYEVADRIATITLDRPDRMNAYTDAMRAELCAVFDEVDADDEVRAVVVTGRGRAFCAGMDLAGGGSTFDHEVTEDARFVNGVRRDGGGMIALRIFRCRKPVIAAVNGAAVGVGSTMTLPMDIRLAADTARFGFVFNRRGITPEACSSWFLPRVVGISTALEWSMSGRLIDAAEAHARGLVRSVFPAEDLLPKAYELAHELTDQSAPISVALTRQLMWRMLGAEHPMAAHKIDSRAMNLRGASADAREGIEAFLEKRPAQFPMTVSQDYPDLFPPEPDFS